MEGTEVIVTKRNCYLPALFPEKIASPYKITSNSSVRNDDDVNVSRGRSSLLPQPILRLRLKVLLL